ncbi:NUDIX hydrolase [Nocardia sp. BMG51109]|uniref:NUDIX hydrolase n=1 Tax=Nocardia sp. BMG51109 TaxID=1056816 RepID=UPI0004BBB9A0|nr:NUDIX domain-containing protein [Nocardia sp. BMG51109]
MKPATALVSEIVQGLTPLDALERQHIDETLTWLAATDDIFRRIKPAAPSPHLVSYVVLVDPAGRALYLGHHRKSNLELPMGGHVEPGEHPLEAARREATEEIGIAADFSVAGERPLMLTVTTTVGADPHVDVSLWYAVRCDRSREYPLAPAEFTSARWWDLDPYGLPQSDPHLPRFIRKLDSTLPPVTR